MKNFFRKIIALLFVVLFFTGTSGWAYTIKYCSARTPEKVSCCKMESKDGKSDNCCCHKSPKPISTKKSAPGLDHLFSASLKTIQEKQACCISILTYFNFPVYKSFQVENNIFSDIHLISLFQFSSKLPEITGKNLSHYFSNRDYGIPEHDLFSQHSLLLI